MAAVQVCIEGRQGTGVGQQCRHRVVHTGPTLNNSIKRR